MATFNFTIKLTTHILEEDNRIELSPISEWNDFPSRLVPSTTIFHILAERNRIELSPAHHKWNGIQSRVVPSTSALRILLDGLLFHCSSNRLWSHQILAPPGLHLPTLVQGLALQCFLSFQSGDIFWYLDTVSNRGPSQCKCVALPLSYRGIFLFVCSEYFVKIFTAYKSSFNFTKRSNRWAITG